MFPPPGALDSFIRSKKLETETILEITEASQLLLFCLKLHAMILEARATAWAEESKCRARGQAGFRKDHRTTDQLFIIRTLLQQSAHAKHKLYCCFVEFKKAF